MQPATSCNHDEQQQTIDQGKQEDSGKKRSTQWKLSASPKEKNKPPELRSYSIYGTLQEEMQGNNSKTQITNHQPNKEERNNDCITPINTPTTQLPSTETAIKLLKMKEEILVPTSQ